jgi:hypothetical protein
MPDRRSAGAPCFRLIEITAPAEYATVECAA